ncbi:hypothetical protein ACXZ9C_10870 [Streptococcus agalactiae]
MASRGVVVVALRGVASRGVGASASRRRRCVGVASRGIVGVASCVAHRRVVGVVVVASRGVAWRAWRARR